MEAQSVVAVYAIVVGILVGGLWLANLRTGRVPELNTRPWEIRLHVAAETLLALTMIAGGVAALLEISPGSLVVLFGLGMTWYSIVNSSGYYIERHERVPVMMFALLAVLTALATATQIAILTARPS